MTDRQLPSPWELHFSQISFIKSAPTLAQCPDDVGIEVAFVGRSNAGKSSAINAITGKARLAHASKTPGRTQLMNFFKIDADRRLVDLPGYGYAKVPQKVQIQAEQQLSDYLSHRQCLYGLVLLMDIRHPFMPGDRRLIDFCLECQRPVHILLTKSDKLKRGPSQSILLQVRKALDAYPQMSVQTFSALKGFGLEEIHAKLQDWFDFNRSD